MSIFLYSPDLIDPTSDVSRTWSSLYLLWYAYLATLVVRCKYYHAWLMSEAICNNSGLGFNGYDKDGSPKWDKVSNVDVFAFEVSIFMVLVITSLTPVCNNFTYVGIVVFTLLEVGKLIVCLSLTVRLRKPCVVHLVYGSIY